MPSPYRIELTRAEREELEARTRRYTSRYRDVVRAKLVLLAAQGVANDIIAARLDLSRQWSATGENASGGTGRFSPSRRRRQGPRV